MVGSADESRLGRTSVVGRELSSKLVSKENPADVWVFTDFWIMVGCSLGSLDYYKAQTVFISACKINTALPVGDVESLDGSEGFDLDGIGRCHCNF